MVLIHTRVRSGRAWRRAWAASGILAIASAPFASCSSSGGGPPELGAQDGSAYDHTASDVGALDTSSHADAPGDTASDAGVTDAPACKPIDGAPQSFCNGGCTDTSSDPKNCGQCLNACPTGIPCLAGKCDCPIDAGLELCNAACIDKNNDPANCGTCGHACQGSTCTSGLCVPTQVANSGTLAWDIAVDSTTMYWTQQGALGYVYKKPFAGNTATAIVQSLNDPRGIAVDQLNAYWVDYADTTVMKVALLGGSPIRLWPPVVDGSLVPGPSAPIDVAVDSQNVYWISNGDGQVLSIPINGGTPTVISSGEDHPVAVAVDGTNVYWVDQGSLASNGLVRQKNKTGSGVAVTLAQGEPSPWDIALDASSVYWTDKANPGFVKKIPIGGGTIVTLAQNEGAPYGVTVDAQYVYWTDFDDNTVKRLPTAGGTAPFTLATAQNTPTAIAVDAVNVYWVSQGGGYIWKVAK